jgi:hypothetical protein
MTLGSDHPRSINFVKEHAENEEFVKLAKLATLLRKKIEYNCDNR